MLNELPFYPYCVVVLPDAELRVICDPLPKRFVPDTRRSYTVNTDLDKSSALSIDVSQ